MRKGNIECPVALPSSVIAARLTFAGPMGAAGETVQVLVYEPATSVRPCASMPPYACPSFWSGYRVSKITDIADRECIVTVCVDPGSEYSAGTLRGAIINLERDRVLSYQFTTG